jgi:putative aldouronate transport system substrate-binding protein
MSDYFDQMPDYMRHWTGEYAEYWKECLQFSRAPDGKVYFLPLTNKGYYQLYRIGWVYRGDIFEKHGLEFPDTMEGLIDVMKQLKELYPDSVVMNNRNGLGYFLWGAHYAYRTGSGVHFDVDTDELVYGPATDKYRKVLAWATEVYENGLVTPEFATATFQQYREILATGKNFIEHQWATNAPHFLTQTTQEADPNAYWTYYKYGISGIPGKESIVDKNRPYVTAGGVIMRTDQEKVDRLIEYLNWSATDEGMIAHQYGEPGVTMQMVGGIPRFLTTDGEVIDSWETQEKARAEGRLIDGTDYNLKGPHPSGACYWWYYPEAQINPPEGVVNAQVVADDLEAIHKHRDFIRRIPWDFTKTEDKDRADVQTVVNDTYQEYALKFIMGDLDINSDGDWEDYQAALKKAGVDRLLQLYQRAYDRIEW